MVDKDRSGHAACDVVLISNGFQAEYETGFANGLAHNGLRPLLVCSDNLLHDRLDERVATCNLRGSQRPDRPARAKAANILRYWWQLHRLLRRQANCTAHVIGLFTLPSAVAALAEALALRLSAGRFVLTVHNLLPHDAHGALNRLLYRGLYRLPHTLVVHTQRMRQSLQDDFGVPAQRIVVMAHGIDRLAPRAQADLQWLARHLSLPAGRPVVLFFGAISPYKGLDILVDALMDTAARLDAVLVVAGRCRDAALRRTLTPGLSALVAQGRARWVDGFIPERDVLHYFHGADVLVMPYRQIDQSGVVFMALSTGLPVVASHVGSLAEVVPLTGGRLVPAGDATALLAGLREVLAEVPQSDRATRVQQAEQHLWSHTVRALISAYRRAP